MFNGRALYKIHRAEYSVDDNGYLIVNDGQPYSIEIASPTRVETFVLWFPTGWADAGANSASFFERYTPHDQSVSPKVHLLRAAFRGKEVIEDEWLEEKLRE